ncbi:ABC-type multidrug transport system, permease component [Maledivibacter halophilus]|uniref:ABC-type multidrug transport system, permease component n=2 Tax=Maledivibacter halophilus TaxID=36842 RepID=A0A1T5LTN9_9FIRM|nr:ABC-type multidrug transport system, permease component [Maledivibacter halophilus]
MESKNTLVILMKKLNLKSEYNQTSMLAKMEIKRVTSQISNVVLLVLLLIIFVNMFIFIYKDKGPKIHSNVALAIEDNSVEVKTLLKNITENKLKEIIEFKEVSLKAGFDLLKENEVIALIHLKEGTTELLNYGRPAAFDLYINDHSDIKVKFLINYLESLVKVLNEGQNGSMIYWDIMKSKGLDFDERLNNLNRIALNYMAAFLTRGDVFESTDDLDKFYGAATLNYYFVTSLLIISIISTILFHLDINDDIRKGRIRRVLSSGYNLRNIYSAKIITGSIFTSILMGIFKGIFMIFFDVFVVTEFLRFISCFFIINIIIHMVVIVFYILIDNDRIRDWLFILFFTVLSFTSGIIIPLNSLGGLFKILSKFNILTIGHNLLLGYSLTLERAFITIIYFFIITVTLRYVHKIRRV